MPTVCACASYSKYIILFAVSDRFGIPTKYMKQTRKKKKHNLKHTHAHTSIVSYVQTHSHIHLHTKSKRTSTIQVD